jgi:transposase
MEERVWYSKVALERAMQVQDVILKALAGTISWFKAADILGVSVRSMRRYRARFEESGYHSLYDRRRQIPSPRRVAVDEVKRILALYRERYSGWNVRHFHQTAVREHEVKASYSFVKQALQGAGLARKYKARGRHRRRRERKACFGEMLHIDGSKHVWLALVPDEKQSLISIVDDATSRVLYSQLWAEESTRSVMVALREVVGTYGIPTSIYSDRASWAFETTTAGMKVSKTCLTQVGLVLKRLGVEHIPSYSPQARGRSERMNGTLQGRLVNELKLAGAQTIEAANKYLRDRYLSIHNETFSVAARDADTAFVAANGVDLDDIFCREIVRHVGKDNVVTCDHVALQLLKQPGRRTCAGMTVTVKQRLDGRWFVQRGPEVLGRFEADGRPMDVAGRVESRRRPRLSTTTLGRRHATAGAPQRPQAQAKT